MKNQTTPQKPSAKATGEPASGSAKRKAAASLEVDTTPSFTAVNTPKRLRTSPLSATTTQAGLTIPTPTDSVPSPLPPTPATPQTPSTPAGTKLSARKQRTINDPLNVSIYDLRRQGLDWDVIADQTNAACNVAGTASELTGNACYGRFFRNGPVIARERGDEFQKEWYLHMRGPVASVVSANAGSGADAGGDAVGLGIDGAGLGGGVEGGEDAGEETELDEDMVKAEVADVVAKLKADFWETAAVKVNMRLGRNAVTAEQVREIDARAQDGEM